MRNWILGGLMALTFGMVAVDSASADWRDARRAYRRGFNDADRYNDRVQREIRQDYRRWDRNNDRYDRRGYYGGGYNGYGAVVVPHGNHVHVYGPGY